MKKVIINALVIFGLFTRVIAQDQLLQDIATSLRASNAHQLVNYMGISTKVKTQEETKYLNKVSAEKALREFFNANKVKDFQFTTPAKTVNSMFYIIGEYLTYEGASYRVYLLFKEENKKHVLSTLSFSTE
ncbi:MAG: DUF4783 domain-containing protein [Flammeovirgaceae bacterium]|jgi:hypothetical protein|nr:DUF4783 domain-containing protein [Flammeovirgaceae bacterium]|tara:strand:+ start:13439 stop:13831 length:393 start_codon:yes stop_codon:yes gene_type:complete